MDLWIYGNRVHDLSIPASCRPSCIDLHPTFQLSNQTHGWTHGTWKHGNTEIQQYGNTEIRKYENMDSMEIWTFGG